MMNFKDLLKKEKIVVGMIHIKALPGTPNSILCVKDIISHAISEAEVYKKLGINTVLIENMHDTPYTKKITPEIVSVMSIIGYEIKKLGLYCGVQILAAGNKEALAVAKAANLDFIRVEGFVYAHIADEGYIESCAGELLRYRKMINATNVLIFTDIKKKHSSHSITNDVDIGETAHTAQFFGSDGLIVTGISTGEEPLVDDVKYVKKSTTLPLIIGSGITKDNLEKYFDYTAVFVVGSYFKKEGNWANEIDEKRVSEFMTEFNRLKKVK